MHPAPSIAELLTTDDQHEKLQQQQQQQQVSHPHDHQQSDHHQHLGQPPQRHEQDQEQEQKQKQKQKQEQEQEQEHDEQEQENARDRDREPEPGGHPYQLEPQSPRRRRSPPPVRKDTGSSTSTAESDITVTSTTTNDSNSTVYSVESSQSIFSIKDGSEISSNRRASRRRTGPLSAQQREKAALIRKLGACTDCRRRRVACHPNHHNMTWEDAIRKYQRAHSPMQELAPLAGRPISPSPSSGRHGYVHDAQEMEVDSTPTPPGPLSTPGRAPLSDSRIRTPLPSGPRLDKPISISALAAAPLPPTFLPNIDFVKSELETNASRILTRPYGGRYSNVLALLICWQDDEEPGTFVAVEELGRVFDEHYNFTFKPIRIPPSSSDECRNSARWLLRTINDFTDNSDTREVLKIVYYNGCTYLDENGELVLASSSNRDIASTIRWSGVQQLLEEARSDTLILIDAAYYPSSKMVRQKGVLELVAASASEEHFTLLGRNSFTRELAEQLRSRAIQQRAPTAFSVAELHSRLLAAYRKVMQDRQGNSHGAAKLPLPLHLQMSGNPRLPSITLFPLQAARPRTPTFSSEFPTGPQLTLSIRLTEEALNIESWTEWLRMMPDGIKDVKVEGPYRTFR